MKTLFNVSMAKLVENEIKSYMDLYVENNVHISGYISPSGGSLEFTLLKNIKPEDIQYNKRLDINGSNLQFLIEQKPVSRTEPYDRSKPFYLPVAFAQLNMETFSDFDLLYSKKCNKINSSKELQNFYYNSVWDYYRFDVIVKPENVQKITALLSKSNIPVIVISKINKIIEDVFGYIIKTSKD